MCWSIRDRSFDCSTQQSQVRHHRDGPGRSIEPQLAPDRKRPIQSADRSTATVVASATISNRTCWKQIHSTKERSFTELRFASSLAQLWVTWGAVKGQDERPFGAPLPAPHVTLGSYAARK